jgi:hypothetical protein
MCSCDGAMVLVWMLLDNFSQEDWCEEGRKVVGASSSGNTLFILAIKVRAIQTKFSHSGRP